MEYLDLGVGGVQAEHPCDLGSGLGLFCAIEGPVEAGSDSAIVALIDSCQGRPLVEVEDAEHELMINIPVVWGQEEVAVGAHIAGEIEVGGCLEVECGAHWSDRRGTTLDGFWLYDGGAVHCRASL